MTVNELVAFNIKYLASQKGLKLGDIERSVGVNVGYFSRKLRTDTSIPLDIVYACSQILDVTIDELCGDIRLKELQECAEKCGYKLVPIDEGDEK